MARCISNFNPLNANLTKCSDTLKQFVGKLPTNYLIMFDQFCGVGAQRINIVCDMSLSFSGFTCLLPW